MASASDPALRELAARPGPADVYVAAAVEVARRRRATDGAAAALGAPWSTLRPDVLASKVTDVYLDLKAAGRL